MHTEVDGRKAFFATGSGSIDRRRGSVVFIHGAGLDHTVWTPAARCFARHGLNAIAVDLPGHGRSEGRPLSSIEAMADWISAVLRALDLDAAAIAGHSMGSLVALATAARHPEQTRSLALLGTSVPMPVTHQLLDAAKRNSQEAIDMTNTWSHSRAARLGGNEVPGVWMTSIGQRLLERAGRDVLFTDLSACNEFAGGLELAKAVKCPALVIIGAEDAMTSPAQARKLAAAIADSRTVVLEGCGHAMLSERPNEVLDALIELITRISHHKAPLPYGGGSGR
jgi:pimeloyl-ACP methyl ester carboxylesterase